MGEFRRVDRRREPRTPADLPLLVWGVDIQGERFMQEAQARDISLVVRYCRASTPICDPAM
jgi:hypothetical protein